MKAGIAIDKYKLETFKKHLDEAGYKYIVGPGITKDTLVLCVDCEFTSDLQAVVRAANIEARKLGHTPLEREK